MEYNDIYTRDRRLTGKTHLRGSRWLPGEYGLTVCVWVYDGKGRLLLTRRAKGKSYAGTWENSGGAALAGETSRQAIARELFEETGIRAGEAEFELLSSEIAGSSHFDFYCLCREVPLAEIVLLPGETDAVMWATFDEVHQMIEGRKICKVIANQFLRQEKDLLVRQK